MCYDFKELTKQSQTKMILKENFSGTRFLASASPSKHDVSYLLANIMAREEQECVREKAF